MQATRELAGLSASEEVQVTEDDHKADPDRWPALAGASAWLSLAESLLQSSRDEDALVAASSGIEELGDLYRSDLAKDDTKLKLLAAQERGAEGAVREAATMTVRVLRERVEAARRGR